MTVLCLNDVQAVKEKFRDHDEAVLPFPVEFEKDAVVLKIRQKEYQNEILYPEGLDVDGWKITPDNYAEVWIDTLYNLLQNQ